MRIYELKPQFDARKSFYGKAHVLDYENQENLAQLQPDTRKNFVNSLRIDIFQEVKK